MIDRFFPTIMLLAIILPACGSNTKPTTKHTISLHNLSATPPDKREEIANLYRNHYVAAATWTHARFLVKDAQQELSIAKAEHASASHTAKATDLKLAQARAKHMPQLVNNISSHQLRSRQRQQRLAQKIAWLESHIPYLRKHVLHAQAEKDATHAQFELKKARLAQAQGISPKNFRIQPFIVQATKTKTEAHQAHQAATVAKRTANRKHRQWQSNTR